jgi:small subunit ribosomal protein S4
MVFESGGATRALEKRENPPGMALRRKKPTNYGRALNEKQKIKYYYGLRERQLRNAFDKARRIQGNTGENLMVLCERRLDNVIRRAGLAATRPQARQGIVHAHFQLNGQTVTIPSILVRPGDVISIRPRPNLKELYKSVVESTPQPQCNWISFDAQALEARVNTLPTIDDVSLPVDVGQVVAFLSR